MTWNLTAVSRLSPHFISCEYQLLNDKNLALIEQCEKNEVVLGIRQEDMTRETTFLVTSLVRLPRLSPKQFLVVKNNRTLGPVIRIPCY